MGTYSYGWIINVYNQEYESGAAFWPDVHGRIIFALVFSQFSTLGLLSTKRAAQCAPFLIALPILTITFQYYCKGRYESAFTKLPLQMKDTLEHAREPHFNLKVYLKNAYVHPVFKGEDDTYGYDKISEKGDLEEGVVVPTKRQSRRTTPAPSQGSN
ncbi:hypothetical protein DM860_003667 [Cuscuta australis]|uniref:CSC1/OSCA1-like 7TM region domain-containing protein n=1 Tax=Cuscuta australis TaxID=267555 RepID=A0A328DJW3_9ASTE|nr:hypothetical protein DM860_003667 [Cuscuta australis]